MTRALLDVTVLIALLDSEHVHHSRARRWFVADGPQPWASCAITQNGFVRVVSQRRYPNPKTVADACNRLHDACASEHHDFWTCAYSVLDDSIVRNNLLSSRELTDVYLLGLAVHHRGRLVTFDTSIPLGAVPAATTDHLLVL